MARDTVRIGGAAGFWGDSLDGARQLVLHGDVDVLVFDYLAEVTISLLARMRARKPAAGYVTDFIDAIAPVLGDIKQRGIRVISNAGGINPQAAAAALGERARSLGLAFKIAVVTGDDLMPRADELRRHRIKEMFTGADLPPRLLSANAYLGARPIAAALDRGADIVITGRCVDSAVTLGALVHRFGWRWSDWDRLAQGSVAGHLLECSTQVTGGIATDWADVPGWDDMGLPIAECSSDGTFIITKPQGTGGLITPLTVGEQLLYEIGDPAAYVLPDVQCDLRQIRLTQRGADCVEVRGARGRPPTADLKVSATYADGYRAIGTVTLAGRDAAPKARRAGAAIFKRARRLLAARQLGDFTETSIEVLGTEAVYGASARAQAAAAREVVLKLAATHPDAGALEIFAREIIPAASSMAQGLTGFFAGRPGVQPVVRLFSFLWPKRDVQPLVSMAGEDTPVPFDPVPAVAALPVSLTVVPAGILSEPAACVPLVALAVGRSGDKGNMANIGIIARRAEYLPWIKAALTSERLMAWFAQTGVTHVERFDLPGMHAINFLLHEALGGGGMASLRIDPQGKAFAQMLMDIEVAVPAALADAARAAGYGAGSRDIRAADAPS
ncbi:MAG: DUF1446 domain-containing protein [Hyphomonadaceae bacterium]|nr:DUF1446 domain-containing protein [Hyphomonadaceae bacterium]